MNSSLRIYFGGLLVVFSILISTAASASQEQQWRFQVLLDDKAIGYHEFRRIPRGSDSHQLEINARFDVKFLFITAYRYRHNNVEVWRNECLQSIEARTDDNGRQYAVIGRKKSDAFELASSDMPRTTPGCIKTFAYWDPAILKAERLLNAQTGEFVDIDVVELGEETINVRGQQVTARRYRLDSEEATIDLWYEADSNRWLALQTTTEGGRKLNYMMI